MYIENAHFFLLYGISLPLSLNPLLALLVTI
jgi:hypothetical protein